MPMTKWSGSSKGKVMFNENLFRFNVKFNESINKLVFKWTQEICDYRLHYHFERKNERGINENKKMYKIWYSTPSN
jgi:CRISPR/Cas system-associated endonuclease/helicase Cas3